MTWATVDWSWWCGLATGIAIGLATAHHRRLVDWLADRLDPPAPPARGVRQAPVVRLVPRRQVFDQDRDGGDAA